MEKLTSVGGMALKNFKPHLQTFLYYAKVELTPPNFSEIGQIPGCIAKGINTLKSGSWKQFTVKQAFLNALVGTEVFCWFFIGECIGKRHLVGYDLSAAHPKGGAHH